VFALPGARTQLELKAIQELRVSMLDSKGGVGSSPWGGIVLNVCYPAKADTRQYPLRRNIKVNQAKQRGDRP